VLENGKQKPPRRITGGMARTKSSLFIFMNFLRIIFLQPFSASFFFYPGNRAFWQRKIHSNEPRKGQMMACEKEEACEQRQKRYNAHETTRTKNRK